MNHAWRDHPSPGTVQSNNKSGSCHQYPKNPGPALNNNSYNNPHQQNNGCVTTHSTAGWDRPGSSSQKWHSSGPEAEEDPDGFPYEPDEEDPELARKRKELQVIEERIMLKRASIALKTVTLPKTSVKTARRRCFTENPNSVESNKPLRERVKHILQLRNREIRKYGPITTSNRWSLNVQNDHPLKWRVEAALHQRFVTPPVEPLNCKPVPLPSSPALHQNECSPVKEEVKRSNQGFLRFLNILNKGVDIKKLIDMVNNDPDGLLHSTQSHSQNDALVYSAASLFEYPPVEKRRLEEKEHINSPPLEKEKLKGKEQHIKSPPLEKEKLEGKEQCFKSPPLEKEKFEKKEICFKSPPLEKKKLEEKEQRPKTETQQKHLQNILASLGLSLGTDEISRLSDRTQERLYGKKQSPGEDKTKTDQQQKEEEKYSPARQVRSSSSEMLSSSRVDRSPSRTPSLYSPQRSPSLVHGKQQRSSCSPHRTKSSHSPDRKKDSQRSKSPRPENRHDPQPPYPPPVQPYPYPPALYFNPHFPPQIYPHAYSYSQYATRNNYWTYDQPPAPGLMGSFYPNYQQNIPSVSPYQQTDPQNTGCVNEQPNEMETDCTESLPEELQKLSNNSKTRCLVPVKRLAMSMEQRLEMERRKKVQQKALNRTRKRRAIKERIKNKGMDWQTKINVIIDAIKMGKDPAQGKMAGESASQGTSNTPQNPTDEAKPKKKKKKRFFIERNEQMEEMLNDRPGPVTRGLGLKNPAKLTGYRAEMVEIKDVEVPVGELEEDKTLNAPVEGTIEEEEEKKPKLLEEEIKANLKKKLEAFNTRMKTKPAQPPVLGATKCKSSG